MTTLGIIGAGPKAMAIAAKARVLKGLGFQVPDVVIFERGEIAENWRPSSGLTSGDQPLGTPPDKDVGYPYHSFLWGDAINRDIDAAMMTYSWQRYLVWRHDYSEWVDRGRPAPTHRMWASYLRWVYRQLADDVEVVKAEVKDLAVRDGRWRVRALAGGAWVERQVDGLVLTGPGDVKLHGDLPMHPRIRTVTEFWLGHRDDPHVAGKAVAVVGGGETAATVAAAVATANPHAAVDIVSSQAMAFSRGESYAENHVYSDPFQSNWLELTLEDRRQFVNRTDRGVFSVAVKQELDRLRNVEIVPGTFKSASVDALDQVLCRIAYAQREETRIYDLVVVAVGFDHVGLLRRLLSDEAIAGLQAHLGTNALGFGVLEESIDQFLAVRGFRPRLHLPMLAGLNQGPGFPNLSSLGRLSDHVLAAHVPVAAVGQVGSLEEF